MEVKREVHVALGNISGSFKLASWFFFLERFIGTLKSE